jgi:hypothetical protein
MRHSKVTILLWAWAVSGLVAGGQTQIDRVASNITVGGLTIQTASPPKPLILREELGIVTTPAVSGQIIHHARDREKGLYETRAVVTPKGDFLLMFPDGAHYGGSSAKANDMLSYRSSDRGKTWRGPSLAFDIDYNQHGFIPLIPRGSHRIYAFGTQPIWGMYTREHGLQENAPIGYRYSDDDGHTWSEVRLIRPVNDPDFTGMSVTRMCETERGTWLLGAHEGDYSYNPVLTRQYLLRSEDRGATWTVLPRARHGGWYAQCFNRMDEGRPIDLGGGKVLLMARTPEGHLWELRSSDDGRTWSEPKPTRLVHPDAPPMLFHLTGGENLIVFFHNRHHAKDISGIASPLPETKMDRSEIWFATSGDGGLTWNEPRFLFATALAESLGSAFRDYNISYLDMILDQGVIHLFVPHRWERVLHLEFLESNLAGFPTKADLRNR